MLPLSLFTTTFTVFLLSCLRAWKFDRIETLYPPVYPPIAAVFRGTTKRDFALSLLFQLISQNTTLEISVLETVSFVQTSITEIPTPSLTVRLHAVYYPIKQHKRRLNQTAVVKWRRCISREYSTVEQTDLWKTEAGRVYDNPIHRSTHKVQ